MTGNLKKKKKGSVFTEREVQRIRMVQLFIVSTVFELSSQLTDCSNRSLRTLTVRTKDDCYINLKKVSVHICYPRKHASRLL